MEHSVVESYIPGLRVGSSPGARSRYVPPILRLLALAVIALTTLPAFARIGLIVGEPFGSFGTMMPSGHASVYLDRLCAETPTHLRPCRPGEPGVVVSRYHDIPGIDWMATPVTTFLYGVDDPAKTPPFVSASLEGELRESYREAHLRSVVPDRIDRDGDVHLPKYGDWAESIGAAFDRRLLLYTIDSTPAQDAAMLALLNDHPDRRRYTLHRNNCADFAAEMMSMVLDEHIPRNRLADFDMMSPKQLARIMDAFGHSHPELHMSVYEIPQIPGSLRRSRPVRGAAETLLKTKRYLATVLVLQPEFMLADWVIYEKKGRWTPGLDAQTLSTADWNALLGSRQAMRASAESVAQSE